MESLVSIVNFILYSVNSYTIQFAIEALIYHVLVFYYLLILSLVLVSLLHLFLALALMLPPPIAHPQRRKQVASVYLSLELVSPERLSVE